MALSPADSGSQRGQSGQKLKTQPLSAWGGEEARTRNQTGPKEIHGQRLWTGLRTVKSMKMIGSASQTELNCTHLDQVRRLMTCELEVWQRVSAGDPGMLQHLLCCVSLVRVHMEHVREEVLPQTSHGGRVTRGSDGVPLVDMDKSLECLPWRCLTHCPSCPPSEKTFQSRFAAESPLVCRLARWQTACT